MRRFLVLSFVMLLAMAALGQGLNVAESAKKPGDPLRYTITLDSPVKGTVNTVYLSFTLNSPQRADQKGLQTAFSTSKFKEVSPTEYQIDDSVPAVMSGTYLLNSIQFRTSNGAIGNYGYPQDFKQENTIKIDTPAENIFPNIKSVTPSH